MNYHGYATLHSSTASQALALLEHGALQTEGGLASRWERTVNAMAQYNYHDYVQLK